MQGGYGESVMKKGETKKRRKFSRRKKRFLFEGLRRMEERVGYQLKS